MSEETGGSVATDEALGVEEAGAQQKPPERHAYRASISDNDEEETQPVSDERESFVETGPDDGKDKNRYGRVRNHCA